MASNVRAGETAVDCKEAKAEIRTAKDIIIPREPSTGPERTAKIFSWLSEFPRPRPSEDVPANAKVPTEINRYSRTTVKIVPTAA